MSSKITPEMIIANVLKMHKGTVPIFMKNGLHCLGCPSASGESIKDACEIHGLDCNKLLKELNDFFETLES